MNILQSRCFRKCVCCMNISQLYQTILLFKCLSVLVLSAGVRGVRCTLCSIFPKEIPEAKWHIITPYYTIYDNRRKSLTDTKIRHLSNHYAEKIKVISCKFAFGTLCELCDAAAATSPRCCYQT